MDKILEGTINSDKPDGLKKQMCRKVEDLGRVNQAPIAVFNMLDTTSRIIFSNPQMCIVDGSKSIFLTWGKNNRAQLEEWFTPAILHKLLDEKFPNQLHAFWIAHQSMLLIRSDTPAFHKLCNIVEVKVISFVRQYPAFEMVSALCRFLFDFRDCIPKGQFCMTFCTSLISAAGTFHAPSTPNSMKIYIRDVTYIVGNLLHLIWQNSADSTIVVKCLEQVFSIISHVNQDLAPSLALAGIVPHIPLKYVDSIVKQTVTNPAIADENMKEALGRMIDWLTWPVAKNLNQWIIAFFKGLASVHKYTILMDVTEEKVAQVYDKLHFPIVKHSAFEVLSHMLLSFQHSPEAFHKVVQFVPTTMQSLKEDVSEPGVQLVHKVVTLLHCLMSHHLGFPELYEPVLRAVKGYPKPSSSVIKKYLAESSWKANQTSNLNTPLSTWLKKSETGKTGLINLGNTCYANSVVQALFMCDSFRQEVVAVPPNRHQTFLRKIQIVFAFLSGSTRTAYIPGRFLEFSRPPWFNAGFQQDCSEFQRYLYDQLHEQDISSQRALQQKDAPRNPQSLPVQTTDVQLTPTLIQRTFAGRIITTVRCLSCQNKSSHSEMFTDLSLAFPENINGSNGKAWRNTRSAKSTLAGGSSTSKSSSSKPGKGEETKLKVVCLEELLTHFLKPEKLQGDNQYHCDKCQGLHDGERVIELTSPPEYLNLTLMRFSYNVKSKTRSKIFTEVAYPKTLKIPILLDESQSGTNTGKQGKVKKSKSDVCQLHYETYCLCAVIVHSGYSSDSGHYYCHARHSIPVTVDSNVSPVNQDTSRSPSQDPMVWGYDCDYLQDKWYLFNDSRVSYSSYDSFSNVTKTFAKDTAYVLIYKRIPVDCQDTQMVDANESIMTSMVDPPLSSELRTAVEKDNKLFIQEQELQERSKNMRRSSDLNASQYYNWRDHDDQGPPDNCGGGGGGLSTNRLVC